jgi:CheY-like chemotaxis protein
MAEILVVDDEEMLRSALCRALKSAGHKVTEAANGKEALAAIRSHMPQVMVTDIVMPVKEGIETILEIRRIYGDLKIIAISGGGHEGELSYLRFAEKAGADHVMAKPFSRDDLLRAIEDVISV